VRAICCSTYYIAVRVLVVRMATLPIRAGRDGHAILGGKVLWWGMVVFHQVDEWMGDGAFTSGKRMVCVVAYGVNG
jgi:hypothetical protein